MPGITATLVHGSILCDPTQPNPSAGWPNPWVDPTHGQLCRDMAHPRPMRLSACAGDAEWRDWSEIKATLKAIVDVTMNHEDDHGCWCCCRVGSATFLSLSLSRSTQSILSAVIPFRSPTSIPAVSTMACYWCYCFPWLLPTNTKINANSTAAVIWKQATLQGADVSIGNYAVSPPEKRPPFCFLNNSVKKLTDFDDFWYVKSWDNLTWNLTGLSNSPVRCSHFTVENPKKIIVSSIIYPIGMGLWLQLGNGNVKKWE